ncbi:MAG: alpha-galactosidase [Phycisphaerae bacterium]|nr:alpha-galactosidase [Phycisphaerae bacterium]
MNGLKRRGYGVYQHLAFLGLIGVCSGMDAMAATGSILSISPEWQSQQFRRIPVDGITASTSLDSAEGSYGPLRACDADRKTKWVASASPSKEQPQWIRLDLAGGEQRISGIAVFGEAVDNDGILDADVQILQQDGKTFRTVAEIRDAKSGSWLATFEPIPTSAVRLLVTRSAGPTSHTDVFELEVLGPAIPPAELREYLGKRLAGTQEEMAAARSSTNVLTTIAGGLPSAVQGALAEQEKRLRDASDRLGTWDALSSADRDRLVRDIEVLAVHTRQTASRLTETAKTLPVRRQLIQEMCQRAKQAGMPRQATARKVGDRIDLVSERVIVALEGSAGTWSVVWPGVAEAAICRARSKVEVDGKDRAAGDAKTTHQPFEDHLGKGQEIKQVWGDGIRFERSVRIYDGLAIATAFGRIANPTDREVSLGTCELVTVSEPDGGWWHTGHAWSSPAAVFIGGISTLLCEPARSGDLSTDVDRSYGATQILMLANREPTVSLTFGYLTALEARPDLNASYRMGQGGKSFSARQRFLGRKLGPGESVDLDAVYLSAGDDPYTALEAYGDAAAKFTQQPVRKGPTTLWCSWYAHRMAMTEDLVLANAAVAAKHLKPLGFEIMQLDHGWQRGDVTGDWVPNGRFPHGLKWLSDQLASRHGLRLGVWISPTDVAATSETFQKHPDWMLKDENGKPRVNWKWYWKPNPNCYELDATNPAAEKWIEDVFAQLTAWGVSYYKIDFIAACAGEHFRQHDPKATRGWTALRRAMEALRRGAGQDAWIRYTQTPPLLTAGLASGTNCGGDTLDAGLGGNIEVLRANARSLAAGYWLNDRWYHREVCDMSVRMQADIEETRMRLAMMSLAGCSASFSDEFQHLPPSRIRMMQQVLPPGGPIMRPIDLLDRTIPSVWWIHCKTESDEWDVIGLFNFEKGAQERTVTWKSLGLPEDAEAAVFEFWQEKLLGVHKGAFALMLPPQSSRILSIRRLAGRPQIVGTDMHVLQGYREIKRMAWDEKAKVLSGTCERMPGLNCRLYIYVPDGFTPHFEFPLTEKSARLTNVGDHLWMHEIEFKEATHEWRIPF